MCRSAVDGGQRCAAHTRARYQALSVDDVPAYDRAAAEYASTPEGATTLTRDAQTARDRSDFEHEARLRSAITLGTAARAANRETAARVAALNAELRTEAELDAIGYGIDPETLTPDEAFAAISHPSIVDRYTLGECYLLAYAVADEAGWGVVVVGELEEADHTGEVTDWDSCIHAFAQRPDGALVDIRGVHEPIVAEQLAEQWGETVHTYRTAAQANVDWDRNTHVRPDEDADETFADASYTGAYVRRFGEHLDAWHVTV